MVRIDEVDQEIIRELQADGRASLREIARKLGVVEGTIRARLKRLQDEGVLRIIAFADPAKLGHGAMSLAFLEVSPQRHDAVIEELLGWSEISYLSETLSETGICAQLVCRDQEELWAIRQKIALLEGVSRIQMLPEVRVHKIRFTQEI